jgi:pimeloyl-ACP methyl ester carboxylesterase
MRRLGTAGALFALTAALLVSGSQPSTAAPSKRPPPAPAPAPLGSITWGACTDPTLVDFGAQCGTLAVPLDYDSPSAGVVTLALSRVRHTVPDSQYRGVMLVNPGGPGGSGLVLSILGALVPHGAGDAYDWIGFDPRGVGESTPRLSCDPTYTGFARPDYVPTDPADEQAWLIKVKGYAADCAAHNGPLLENMTTVDVANDVEAVRIALGRQQINWYGFSYGTYIGQVYATLFPERVRRMVLDGVVDPRKVWHQANLDQDVAFDIAFDQFFAWIARYDATYHLGTTGAAVKAAFYAARASLHDAPAQGVLGPSEFDDALLGAGYAQFLWPSLAQALSDLVVSGDPRALIANYPGPGDDNGYATYLATECSDAPWSSNWQKWHNETSRIYDKTPVLAWGNAWFNAPCAFWSVQSGKPVHVTGKGAPEILLISQTLDAATPFSGALAVRQIFRDSVLVAEPGGTTHAGSLFGNECTDSIIADYLATGELPTRKSGNKADALCQPLPLPVPDSGAAAAAASTASLASARPGFRSVR